MPDSASRTRETSREDDEEGARASPERGRRGRRGRSTRRFALGVRVGRDARCEAEGRRRARPAGNSSRGLFGTITTRPTARDYYVCSSTSLLTNRLTFREAATPTRARPPRRTRERRIDTMPKTDVRSISPRIDDGDLAVRARVHDPKARSENASRRDNEPSRATAARDARPRDAPRVTPPPPRP